MPLITNILIVLLAKPGLRRAAAPARRPGGGWSGPLSRPLVMAFDGAAGSLKQSLITILAPVRPNVAKADLDAKLKALGGNPAPAASPLGAALAKTGIVHFASLSCIEIGDPAKPSLRLLLELNVDGEADAALAIIVEHAGGVLEPIFREAVGGEAPLEQLLRQHRLDPHPLRWQGSGLQFNGTPEFSVADIERQEELASFCRRALEPYLRRHVGLGGRAWGALQHVREAVRSHPPLADFLIRPGARKLAFPEPVSTEPWSALQSLSDFFFVSPEGRNTVLLLLAALGLITGFNYLALDVLAWSSEAAKYTIPARLMIAFITAVVGLGLLLAAVAGLLVWRLRAAEKKDAVEDAMPVFADVEAAAAVENAPGYVQNHFVAVNRLKPGLLRRITLMGALASIENLDSDAYRKGFVLEHEHHPLPAMVQGYRRGRADLSLQLRRQWESYLEDFIMQCPRRPERVWSNCVGFPRTRYLIMDGADNGDNFKRFTRCKQRLAPFWYSRFPHLTTRAMRDNALIHYGLMRANNDAGARAWLRCFGSMQRPETSIEADEAQALVFTGMGDLPYAACGLIRLPSAAADRRAWLAGLLPGRQDDGTPPPLTFGERLDGRGETAACLAFTAEGLAKFGLPPREAADGLGVFPAPFTMGMAARARILGDVDDARGILALVGFA